MIPTTGLPIEEAIPQILNALSKEGLAVLQAPPGAGKTTIIPLALLHEQWNGGRRIVMLEPRRLAARAAAMRMSCLLNEDVGKTVGYRTRLDSRVGPDTRIEVVTEGILTRYIQEDPSLENVSCVIFDEFHERSLQADLGLALCLEARAVFREDLRLLVMSATLDGQEVSTLLGGAPIVRSQGRAFPVAARYIESSRPTGARQEGPTGPAFISTAAGAILSALKEEDGSILVFLPGSGEIRRVEARLREKALPDDVDLVCLYGELSRQEQDSAIRPSPPGRRKVVLATSIAETSITIEGVKVVIDSGLKRVPRFSPSTGMGSLETIRVTRDSAEQRKGRAGRTEPGVCIRLWTEAENAALRDKSTPEVMEADLAPLALELAVWGIDDPAKLKWLDTPPAASFEQAKDVLLKLGAIDKDGHASGHGRQIAALPLHPRLGHMLVKGKELGLGGLACVCAALLEERDIFKAFPDERDPDIRARVEAVIGRRAGDIVDRNLCERVRASARQLERRLGINGRHIDADRAGMLLALAYPDRIGKKRDGQAGKFLLSNGRGALLRGQFPLAQSEYIVAASLDSGERDARIYLGAPVEEAELERDFADSIEEAELVAWDDSIEGVVARRQKRLWGLVLDEERLREPSAERVRLAFLDGIRRRGLQVLPWDRACEAIRERVNFLFRVSGVTGAAFPDMSDGVLLEGLDEWLGPFVEGMNRLEHLKRLDLRAALLSMLDWERQKTLDSLAPSHITVPTGSRIHLDYSGQRPVLAVRLQEMFGLARTPTVAGGRIPVVVHLLSPAGRPLQVTDDLAGFWATSYEMVKKEMKGRYPKHHWPDNPMEAEPTRRAKRKGDAGC